MKTTRLWLLLSLMVLAPLAVLGWVARSALEEQQAQVKAQFEALLQQRVDQAASQVGASISGIAQGLRTNLDQANSPESLPKVVRSNPLALCGFWIDASGRLAYPDGTRNTSQDEKDFISRTVSLWGTWARIDLSGGEEGLARDNRSSNLTSMQQLAQQRNEGWVPWYWEDGLHLLYYVRIDGKSPAIKGVEVDRVALLSWIVGNLPEKDPGRGAFVLLDQSGKVLHKFGGYTIPEQSNPVAEKSLPEPLQGWRVAYHGPQGEWETVFVRNQRLALLSRLGILALLLLGGAAWFWRESTRSLREARQRVDFVNQVSHELKTPLTNIRLYAELLEDEVEEPQREKLRVIRSESERLSRMILNILTFSRKERRKLQLSRQEVDLPELVRETVDHFALSMEKRGIHAKIEGNAPRPVMLDRDAAAQIVANLLSNAEKYAATGKQVVLTLRQGEKWTVLLVRDFGPGVPMQSAQKIFEPFTRLRRSLDEGVSGTGIGLSISKVLAELMDGRLELCKSTGPGAQFAWTIQGKPPKEALL